MKAAIAPAILSLAGCASVPPAGGGPVAPLGGTAYVNGLVVRPLRVVEDSRCPIDAVCVWAGRLVVHTEVRGASWRLARDLELGKGAPVAGGTLTLVLAQPARRAAAAVEPRDYRFTFALRDGN